MAVDLQQLHRTAAEELRSEQHHRWALYALLFVVGLVFAVVAFFTVPSAFSVVLLLVVAIGIGTVLNPVVGVYAIVFFALIGDTATSTWYPFTKNLSSGESILYIDDALVVSPLEVILAVTLISWSIRRRESGVRVGELLAPLGAFSVMLVVGFWLGVTRGGDLNVALWEVRSLVYLPLLYLLITNLFDQRRQYEQLFLVAMGGVILQSLLAIDYYWRLAPEDRAGLESLLEHSATVYMGTLLLYTVALWTIPGSSARRRWWMTLASIPVAWAWVLSQRRAAAVALLCGLVLLGVILLWRNRRTAMWFLSLLLVGTTLYTVAFWNSTGTLGFAAQGVKSIIAPESLSSEDLSSDLYRQVEAFDIWYTIRTDELRGIGFGRPFIQIMRLPDISIYPFWEYMPHNSILWIWMKTGYLGFITMLFVVARALQHGARSARLAGTPDNAAVATSALAFVVMYVVYAYVDIAWDARSMVVLAVALAIGTDMVRGAGRESDAVDADGTPEPVRA
jgi:hypothetical protein